MKIKYYSIFIYLPLISLLLLSCRIPISDQEEQKIADTNKLEKPSIPIFSHPGGTYSNPIFVHIYAEEDFYRIRYTTDGSDPSIYSPIYTVPIAIKDHGVTVQIRARTETEAGLSEESSATFIIDTPFSIRARGGWGEIDYLSLYGFVSDFYLTNMVRFENETIVGVVLSLDSMRSDIIGFYYQIDNGPVLETVRPGTVVIAYDRTYTASSVSKVLRVVGKLTTGGSTSEKTLRINYYPSELYSAMGHTAPGYIIIHESQLAFMNHDPWMFNTYAPTEDDAYFAIQEWGHAFDQSKTATENIEQIVALILERLENARGIPSDAMATDPRTQYVRAISGQDHVWCENIAAIAAYALSNFGFPTRIISVGAILDSTQPPWLLTAEGHVALEVWNSDVGEWIFIDPTAYLVGVKLGGASLNIFDFWRFFNNENYRNLLQLREVDSGNGFVVIDKVLTDSSYRTLYENYYKLNQRFRVNF